MFQIQSPEPPWKRPEGVVKGERIRYSREALRYWGDDCVPQLEACCARTCGIAHSTRAVRATRDGIEYYAGFGGLANRNNKGI